MQRSGHADLPLHGGRVPKWLAERMALLGGAIVEAIIHEYDRDEVLTRLSDPLWFQSFGAVMGMDWHSSGITTSVMGALKRAINPVSSELGLYICGGRGRHSRKTPEELAVVADKIGLNGNDLVRASKLAAKVDNTAIQDGFQLYLHNFILAEDGKWAVVQQGMHGDSGLARRYHWHSPAIRSFIHEPHSAVTGRNQGQILNLVHSEAVPTQTSIVEISSQKPDKILPEIRGILMPRHHAVHAKDVNLKRLGAVIALAYEKEEMGFEDLLLLKGLGPRTLQSLTLVSEVIYGTPSRFEDPARFSFAHGGKDGHPFPVPTKVFDETIETLNTALKKAKLQRSEKLQAFKRLSKTAERLEKRFTPDPGKYEALVEKEWRESKQYGGRTVWDDIKKTGKPNNQLDLFDS